MEIISLCYYLYFWQRFNRRRSNSVQKFSKLSIEILITRVEKIIEILDELKWHAAKDFEEFTSRTLYFLLFERRCMRRRSDCLNVDSRWCFRSEKIERNMNFGIKCIYNSIYSKINCHFMNNLIQLEFRENKIIIDISIKNRFDVHLIAHFYRMSISNSLSDDWLIRMSQTRSFSRMSNDRFTIFDDVFMIKLIILLVISPGPFAIDASVTKVRLII